MNGLTVSVSIFFLFFSVASFAQTDYKTAKVKCRESSTGTASGSGSKQCTPDFGLSGSSEILTHFSYRGLSYSGIQPSLISSFLYNFGSQFRMGAWGANLNLPDANLWLKYVMEIHVKFSQQHDVMLYAHRDQFYANTERNGLEIGMNYFFLEYFYLGISQKNNFESTHTSSQYLTFSQSIPIGKLFNFTYKLGYTNQQSTDYTNYIDAKVLISYDMKNSALEFGLTDMTAKETYLQRAEPHFYGSLLAYY